MSLYRINISSPLGNLVAISSQSHLLLLEFSDSKELSRKISEIEKSHAEKIIEGSHSILEQIQLELLEYFSGKRKDFTIPLSPSGTDFQMQAWKALTKIPYSETRSYKEEAILAGNPKAIRAIGGANHKNPIVIIIPCHRVIGADGSIVGYGGGIERKIWLLEHEKKYVSSSY